MVKGHKTGKVGTHQCCHGGTWYVMLEEGEMRKKLGNCHLYTRLPYMWYLITESNWIDLNFEFYH